MQKSLALTLATVLFITGCATADNPNKEKMAADNMANESPIAQAELDLTNAIAANAQWRVIDKATGGQAVDLSALMKVAKEKAEAGETEEANRIAAHVSRAAKIGIDQAARYAGSKPSYN